LMAAEQALCGHDLERAIDLGHRAVACGSDKELLGRVRLLQAEALYFLDRQLESQASAREALAVAPVGGGLYCDASRAIVDASFRLGDCDALSKIREDLVAQIANWVPDASRVQAVAHAACRLLKVGYPAAAQPLLSWMNTPAALEIAADNPRAA